jgi:UDP-N-acetylmuramoyl-L-alanyl-D-glutamate--2,6-diaminopimelate ligase
VVIPDRRKAIEYAINNSTSDGSVLIAGKGHEKYQIIGNEKFPFSDLECVNEYLLGESVVRAAGI